MSHLGIGPFEFLLLAIYPVVALLIIEIVYRFTKFLSWIKLIIQGLVSIAFGIAYVTIIESHWLTSLVLFGVQNRWPSTAPQNSLDQYSGGAILGELSQLTLVAPCTFQGEVALQYCGR